MEDVLKKKIITVCAAVLFLTALGLTLYPLISNYVNQKYASEIQTAYQVLIQQTDESVLQLLSEKKAIYADYQKARDEMRSLQTAKANVDRILGEDALPVEREPEKDGR